MFVYITVTDMENSREKILYHIVDEHQWKLAQSIGMYEHPTLHAEGFIHTSFKNQVENTANRYFKNYSSITVLKIDSSKIKAIIKLEPASSGEIFPHIYGPLNLNAVISVEKVDQETDGNYNLKNCLA